MTTITHQRPPLPPNSQLHYRPSSDIVAMKYKAVLRPNVPDIAIIYSESCSVSAEWAAYISNLMKVQGYKSIVHHQVESLANNNSGISSPGKCERALTPATFSSLLQNSWNLHDQHFIYTKVLANIQSLISLYFLK